MNSTPPLDLRDIHLPDGVSWWPPAPGWWLLLLGLLLLAAIGVYLYRRRQARRIHRAALQQLKQIKQAYADHGDDQQMVQALSVWLRRVCLSLYPRVAVASLTGRHWLAFLDQGLGQSKQPLRFSEGAGEALLSAPYQPLAPCDAQGLLSICQLWLEALSRHPQVRA